MTTFSGLTPNGSAMAVVQVADGQVGIAAAGPPRASAARRAVEHRCRRGRAGSRCCGGGAVRRTGVRPGAGLRPDQAARASRPARRHQAADDARRVERPRTEGAPGVAPCAGLLVSGPPGRRAEHARKTPAARCISSMVPRESARGSSRGAGTRGRRGSRGFAQASLNSFAGRPISTKTKLVCESMTLKPEVLKNLDGEPAHLGVARALGLDVGGVVEGGDGGGDGRGSSG